MWLMINVMHSSICAVNKWVYLGCVCVRTHLHKVADMPSNGAIKVVRRGDVTLNDASGSLFKVAVLCGDCNANEPLPVSSSTILEDTQAGRGARQVHCSVCVSVCESVCVLCSARAYYKLLSTYQMGMFPCLCLSKHLLGVHCLHQHTVFTAHTERLGVKS